MRSPLFSSTRPPARSTLFPYTTLFRSNGRSLTRMNRFDHELRKPPTLPNSKPHRLKRQVRKATVSPIWVDRKSTRLNSSHLGISYAVFCLKKKINLEEHHIANTDGRVR